MLVQNRPVIIDNKKEMEGGRKGEREGGREEGERKEKERKEKKRTETWNNENGQQVL